MNKGITVLSAVTFLSLICAIAPRAQSNGSLAAPSKVTGGGVYQHLYVPVDPQDPAKGEWWASDEEVGRFTVSINPGRQSPQALIWADGPELEKVWGGPLLIQDDWVWWTRVAPYRPEDLKPGQLFVFVVSHPSLGFVQVTIFTHDNCTPGFNRLEAPNWSDWFVLVIETLGGDGVPGTADDLFVGDGIVVQGNIMDHSR